MVRLIEWWAHLYSDSKALSAAVTFVHLAGILLAGGFAIVADRATLLLQPAAEADLPRELERLRAVHRIVVAGLAVVAASGVLMLLADLHTYLTAILFWVKMALVAGLLFNGWIRQRAEDAVIAGHDAAWSRFRRTSGLSLALWFLVLLAGSFLSTIS